MHVLEIGGMLSLLLGSSTLLIANASGREGRSGQGALNPFFQKVAAPVPHPSSRQGCHLTRSGEATKSLVPG